MKQLTLATVGFERYAKTTRRAVFLAEMEQVVPWPALCRVIDPVYPKAGNGRPPIGVERMLRIYFLQQWFNLSDPAVEEALYDSAVMRGFVGIDLGREPVPDETTVCRFRHLLETHDLEVTANQVREAEGEFSRGRRQSLEYEWRSAFPSLPRLLDYLKGIQRGAVLRFSDLCAKDSMTELVLQIAEKRVDFDPLYPYAQRVCQCQMTPEDFMREVVDILYRVGAVGLKPSPQDRYYYSHIDQPVMEMSGIR